MDVLIVTSELAPYVRVGGVADVIAALSKALRLLGHKVTIAMPRYAAFERSGLMLARRLTPLSVPGSAGVAPLELTVYDGRLPSGVELVLFDAPGLYDRAGVYGEAGVDYTDNARRFGTLSRAVLELLRQRARAGTPFDVVHLHDWPAAPVAYLMRQRRAELGATRSVLTLHSLLYQGMFPREALAHLGLGLEHFRTDRLEFYGQVSFLKAGILAADALTAVSGTFAAEMMTPALGQRLDGVLRTRREQLHGIVNGVDYAVWNPATDPSLIARYDAEDPMNKGRCKSALLDELGLQVRTERPLVASIGRLVRDRGGDLLAGALPRILRSDVTVVTAGVGEPEIEDKLRAAVAKAPERAAFVGPASEAMVHKLLAAADIVVVPARYEPCGLMQLYAQRYGALPVAIRAGGHIDTIVDADAELLTGTGFLYDKPTALSLVGGVQRAVAAIAAPGLPGFRRRVMRLELGWDRPARRYVQVFRDAVERPANVEA